MIGVIADTNEHDIVREFFELFKTPWEFYQTGRQYEIVICSGDQKFNEKNAKLILIYASEKLAIDMEDEVASGSEHRNRTLIHDGKQIPIYGDSRTFGERASNILVDKESRHAAAYELRFHNHATVRIGYDLFREVSTLLTAGQPATCAEIPTLDLHITLLRELIIANGIRLVEIPPVPDGYEFIACLTHDVDHPSVRAHKWDHTMLGFVYRAIWGSCVNALRGRSTLHDLWSNWLAVLKLPAVYLGLVKDFWREFDDHYLEVEKDLSSTFFVIPFKGNPGRSADGSAPAFRAAGYCAQDIKDKITNLLATGREVGLHGIDIWLDSVKGRDEIDEIRWLTKKSEIGVRMHWLYYDQHSPAVLEDAGADYDSTVGYRETVGYRSGTTQGYKPLRANRLLELPMHVMDTALFYPAYMGLSQRQATEVLRRLTENAKHFGGCLTINWHDRSLAPERLWRDCYYDLITNVKNQGAWFATASQAVSWFRKRRSVVFDMDAFDTESVRAKITAKYSHDVPGLRLRIYNAEQSRRYGAHHQTAYRDLSFDESIDSRAHCAVGV